MQLMGISRYNGEGYHDPTTYEALSEIRREEKAARMGYRPLVYICSPFAGDTKGNTEKARRYSRFAVRNTCIPFAPHLLFPQFMDDVKSAERAIALFMGMVLLGKCDQMWVFGSTISKGMAAEIEKAEKRQIPIRYFTEELEEVKGL